MSSSSTILLGKKQVETPEVVEDGELEEEITLCSRCEEPLLEGDDKVGDMHYYCYSHPEIFQEITNREQLLKYLHRKGRREPAAKPDVVKKEKNAVVAPKVTATIVGPLGGRPRKYDYPPGLTPQQMRNFRRRMDRLYSRNSPPETEEETVVEEITPEIVPPTEEEITIYIPVKVSRSRLFPTIEEILRQYQR